MAVLVEANTVIVRNATIQAVYPGGMEGFERDSPNATFCTDGSLARVGFMVLGDAKFFVAALAGHGLTPSRGGSVEDVAIVNSVHGLSQPCSWLTLDRHHGVMIAWLTGSQRGILYAPPGWSFDRALEFKSTAEVDQELEFLRSEENVDVYRDLATGRELFVGRTAYRSPADDARHDELYSAACALIDGLIQLEGTAPDLDEPARKRLSESIPLFEEVVQINPADWRAMWFLGKVYQRFNEPKRSLDWFWRAHRVNPDQPDVAREASIAAMESGRPEQAVVFCQRAIESQPEDPGLNANLALALLFCEKPTEARSTITRALGCGPNDQINALIGRFIDEVLSGTRPCPHHVRDLQ